MRRTGSFFPVLLFLALLPFNSCSTDMKYYSSDDFARVSKTDAHFHYLTTDERYIAFAESLNFRLVTPVWEGEVPIDTQLAISALIYSRHPGSYRFFTSFHTENILEPDFAGSAIAYIESAMKKGAAGVKIWKNIGMSLVRPDSTFIMADDSLLSPVFRYLENNGIPVIAHLGEPRNCWLPIDSMDDKGDAAYYRDNPQYHMYLHPEYPSYGEQIRAIENILAKYPRLDYTGAHLASLEWSVEEIAGRLDRFPNLRVDLAARMGHIIRQSEQDYDRVRSFFIRYQDRIVYGTDDEVHDEEGIDPDEVMAALCKGWLNHWNYLATDSGENCRGLKLPRGVIDKIYFKNTQRYFEGQ